MVSVSGKLIPLLITEGFTLVWRARSAVSTPVSSVCLRWVSLFAVNTPAAAINVRSPPSVGPCRGAGQPQQRADQEIRTTADQQGRGIRLLAAPR